MATLQLHLCFATVLFCTSHLATPGVYAVQVGGYGTAHDHGEAGQQDGASRVESLQFELCETTRERMAAEDEAMRLWEQHQFAEDRSLMLQEVTTHLGGSHAVKAAVIEWRNAQRQAAELWAHYAKAEEHAGALRDEEVEDTQRGVDVREADSRTRKMRLQAEALQIKRAPLKEVVKEWQAAEKKSSEIWSTFLGEKFSARALLAMTAPADHALAENEVDVEDEIESERALAEETRAAAVAKSVAKAAVPVDLAAHLAAAAELVGVAKDVAAHLVEKSANVEPRVAASVKNALPKATGESLAQGGATALDRSSSSSASSALGRFTGHTESFADLSERFTGPLGGLDGFSVAFTARWDALNRWSRILDFGSSVGADGHGGNNIIVANEKISNGFAFHIYGNSSNACLTIPGIIKVGEASRYLCSVDAEGHMRVYQDGSLVGEKKHGIVPAAVHRDHLYVGKSNFKGNAMFEGEVSDLCVWNGAVIWEDTEGCAAS